MAKKKEKFKIGENGEVNIHIAMLLDMSGSMLSVKTPTISGVNEYLSTMKNKNADARFTLMAFNSIEKKTIYKDVAIADVAELTDTSYAPDGNTPLYDSIAALVRDVSSLIEGKANQKVLLMIVTDGMENDSKEYNRDTIKKLITEKEAADWTVSYLGANQDAWAVARSIGVDVSNSMNYAVADMAETFTVMAAASMNYVQSKGMKSRNLFVEQDDDKGNMDSTSQ